MEPRLATRKLPKDRKLAPRMPCPLDCDSSYTARRYIIRHMVEFHELSKEVAEESLAFAEQINK